MGTVALYAVLWFGLALAGGDATPPDDSRRDESVTASAVAERLAPDFPRLALLARMSATVSVEVRISTDGHPVSAHGTAISASGSSAEFERAAEAAALKWRFTSVPSESAERRATITFVFTTKRNDGPVENNEQQAQREVVIKGPLTLEVIEAQSVCYTPAELTVR